MEEVSPEDIQDLLEYFAKTTYKAKEAEPKSQEVMQKCINLIAVDYSHVVINNCAGELSAHYPSQLVILEYERSITSTSGSARTSETQRTPCTIYESVHDTGKLRELFIKARFARCRARFPLPVILYRGKHICRSSTLSGGPEIYGRSGLDYLFSGSENGPDEEEMDETPQSQSDWQLFDRVRNQDIKLLKTLNVGTIVDFMVEKKKVKFGMNVTSSEKVDKENRYSEFTIISLPYPGCEFFREYRDNNYVAKGLIFDWSQAHVDASIVVPEDTVSSQLRINWNNYKMWDLMKLTQNYMKLLLKYLQENSSGLLIHCISGWDRTPLFISLLRLSLWADGVIHQSLSASQILYFTIAYDWMLFGHNLGDRLSKGEEIFFFCFYFLKHITSDEYSISSRSKSKQMVLRNDSDAHLDGLLSDAEGPVSSQGSNISLNSCCSSHSSKSQDNPPAYFHNAPDSFEEISNGNPPLQSSWAQTFQSSACDLNPASMPVLSAGCPRSPHATRTSPVAVPVSARLRQRNDSGSSLSIGRDPSFPSVSRLSPSWQLISGTGSLRGSASGSTSTFESVNSSSRTGSQASICEGSASVESSVTVIEEDDCFIYSSASSDNVSQRRERLNSVRTLFYNAYCATVGFKFRSDTGLGSLLGNFAEKVGIISTPRTSL